MFDISTIDDTHLPRQLALSVHIWHVQHTFSKGFPSEPGHRVLPPHPKCPHVIAWLHLWFFPLVHPNEIRTSSTTSNKPPPHFFPLFLSSNNEMHESEIRPDKLSRTHRTFSNTLLGFLDNKFGGLNFRLPIIPLVIYKISHRSSYIPYSPTLIFI